MLGLKESVFHRVKESLITPCQPDSSSTLIQRYPYRPCNHTARLGAPCPNHFRDADTTDSRHEKTEQENNHNHDDVPPLSNDGRGTDSWKGQTEETFSPNPHEGGFCLEWTLPFLASQQ